MSSLSSVLARKCAPLRQYSRATLFLAALLTLQAVIAAPETSLTLTEAQRLAVARSRQLSAEDSAWVATHEMAIAAGQLPDPVLKFGLDSWPVNGPNRFTFGDDDFTEGRVALSQEWTRAQKRELRAQRFEREGEKTLAEKTATVANIQRDTALAWIDRYYTEAIANVLTEQANEVQLDITAAEGAYRAGRGSQAEVLAAHSALAEIEDRVSEIKRRVRTAKTALARWIGDSSELSLGTKPAMDSVRLDKTTLATQLGHHPQIAVLAKQEELAWTEVKLAEANKHADWSVELAYAQRGGRFSDFVSVSVSVPLLWDEAHRQDREVAAKRALAEQAGAEREEAVRAHVGEILAQIEAWENDRERLTRYQGQLMPLAKARTAATSAAYAGGKASQRDVLLARRDELDIRVRALQLEMDTAQLWAQLNFLFPTDTSVASGNLRHGNSTVTEESK